MKIVCDVALIAEAIKDLIKRKEFLEKFNPEQFPYGIELQTCDRWTTKQQRALWRDIEMAAKLLETKKNVIYSILKSAKQTKYLFEEVEWVGHHGRGKTVVSEKGLSSFTKQDCLDATPVIHEYLETAIQTVYQEKIIFNWSCEENRNLPDFEMTGEPY